MPGIARRITMEYFDEEILEARRELERLKHTTLETGIYVGDELITFTNITLPQTKNSYISAGTVYCYARLG